MSRPRNGIKNAPLCRLSAALLLCALRMYAGYHDSEFAHVPFERWLKEGHSQQIRWSVTVAPAELSAHQRLILRITASVDGRELEKRRNSGAFEGLIEYTDAAGEIWQNHLAVDPAKLQAAMQGQYLDIHFYAFVLPGDYTVSVGVCDPKTLEHSVASRKVHVAALKNDPLPDLWNGLPAVDMIPASTDPPDVWYLPDLTTPLNLAVATKRPVHLRIVLNATPAQASAGSAAALRDNMRILIPALKILSQMRLAGGGADISLLDLTHRKVAFEQTGADPLKWDLMRRFFLDAKPGIVDVKTLEGQHRMLPFFREEVARRTGPDTVVIVLSGPAFYEDQESAGVPSEPVHGDRQLIYIRLRTAAPRRYPGGMQTPNRFGRQQPRIITPPNTDALIPPLREDDLQKIAETMGARIFDAASNLQFRRVLAAVVEQMSHL